MSAPESEFPRVWEWVRASASGRRSAPEPGKGAGVLAGAGAWSEQAESVSVAARYRSFRILRLLFRVSRVLIGSLGSYRVRGQYATCWKLIYPTASVPSGVHCLLAVAEDTPGGQPSVPPWVL